MSAFDLSLVVTAHNENLVSGPTMKAADIAVKAARDAGHSVETIIVLDNATEDTTRYFQQPRFDHWERWVRTEGDLGRVRNAVIPETQGRFVAFLDADDIFSENWLADGIALLDRAERDGECVIAHPELNMIFDGINYTIRVLDQDSPLFTPYFCYFGNYYDSLCMTPREAHLETAYVSRDIPNGLSFQDWQFGIETMAKGWKHLTVPDTVIFKRRRDFSLVRESSARQSILRVLPEMAIDNIWKLGTDFRTRQPAEG